MVANGLTFRCRWIELFAGLAWATAIVLGVKASGVPHWGACALWAVLCSQAATVLTAIAWHGYNNARQRQRGIDEGLAMANIIKLGEYEHADR